ncbi:hypothetical protein D3C87_887430 [compost metagenome]
MKYQIISHRIHDAFAPSEITGIPLSAKYDPLIKKTTVFLADTSKLEFENEETPIHLLLEANGQMNSKKTLDLGYFEKLNNSIKDGNNSVHEIYVHCILKDGYLVGYAYTIQIDMTNCGYMTQIKTIEGNADTNDIASSIITHLLEYHEMDVIYLMGGTDQCNYLNGKLSFDNAYVSIPYGMSDLPLRELLGVEQTRLNLIDTIKIVGNL